MSKPFVTESEAVSLSADAVVEEIAPDVEEIGPPPRSNRNTIVRLISVVGVLLAWEIFGRQIEPLLDFDGEYAARMVNNLDWTEGLSALDFLRDIGKHFRVNKMLSKDAVSARLSSDAGITSSCTRRSPKLICEAG